MPPQNPRASKARGNFLGLTLVSMVPCHGYRPIFSSARMTSSGLVGLSLGNHPNLIYAKLYGDRLSQLSAGLDIKTDGVLRPF